MSSSGGSCERCGGPQFWTIVRGEVWVACEDDCLSDQHDLFLPRTPPLIALEDPLESLGTVLEGEGSGTLEGGDATVRMSEEDELPF